MTQNKVPKGVVKKEVRRLEQINSFLESNAGKEMKEIILKRIRLGLKNLLDVMNSDVPNFDRQFFIRSAQLKADMVHYEDLTKTKFNLSIASADLATYPADAIDEEANVIG